jgi:pimeloyl-[acyl-carrier protein] synthase
VAVPALRDPSPAEFDPRSQAFADDPFPHYAALRAGGAVHWVEAGGEWWAVRHAEVAQVLSDHRFVKGPTQPFEPPPPYRHLPPLQPSMLMRDPPDHTRLRGLVSRAFTPRMVEGLAPRIARLAEELLRPFAGAAARLDLVPAYALPLPATVIAELLGVPVEDRERFQEWSRRIIALLDGTQPEEVRRAGQGAQLELLDYLHAFAGRRRAGAATGYGADLIGALLAAEADGDRLSPGEFLTMCSLLLIAGHETTTNLIAVGTLRLLENPEQLELLRRRPDRMPSAVEELLRFVSPVHLDGRLAAEDVDLGGRRVSAGQWVITALASANRDEAVFADPDRLDLGRQRNPHLAFGRGIHFCLGAPLARLEARIAFETLLRLLPHLALDPDAPPVWRTNLVIRGLNSLPLLVAA